MSNYTMHHTQDYGRRHMYKSEDGRLTVEVIATEHDERDAHCLPRIWQRRGFIDRFMPTTLYTEAYFTDEDGNQWGMFNPCELKLPGRRTINFSRIYEATPENERALVAEAAAMYRDGVRCYESGSWTPCEITPECLA